MEKQWKQKENYDKKRKKWSYKEEDMIIVFIKKNVYLQTTFQTRRKIILDDICRAISSNSAFKSDCIHRLEKGANLDPRVSIEHIKVVSTSGFLSEEGSVSRNTK